MAPMSLLFLGFLFALLCNSEAQTIIGFSSSFPHQDLPISPSLEPTKHTALSLPSRRRTDVPVRATVQGRMSTTNAWQQWQRSARPTAKSASFISALSTRNLSSGPLLIHPTSSRARTDTASLPFSRSFAKSDANAKGSTPLFPTLSSSTLAESSGHKLATAGNTEEESVQEPESNDLQELGSGSVLTMMPMKDEPPFPLPTVGNEMAQYQPPAQTAVSKVSDLKTPDSQTLRPNWLHKTANKITTTPPTEKRATPSPVVTQPTSQTEALTGEKSNIFGNK